MGELNQQEQIALLYEASVNQAEAVQTLIKRLHRLPDEVVSDTSKTLIDGLEAIKREPKGFTTTHLACAFAIGVIVGSAGYFFMYEPKASITLDPAAVARLISPELKAELKKR